MARALKAASDRFYGQPDEENPLWTREDFATARPLNDILIERGLPPVGRPRALVTKTPVNIRLDPEIVTFFKAGGSGWQTRINAVLSAHVKQSGAAPTVKKKPAS